MASKSAYRMAPAIMSTPLPTLVSVPDAAPAPDLAEAETAITIKDFALYYGAVSRDRRRESGYQGAAGYCPDRPVWLREVHLAALDQPHE